MSDESVKLIGLFGSPYAHRAEAALRLKGVPYELVLEEFGSKSELLLQHNPVHKKVPVLLHGGRAVCESMVIAEYVDEAFPGPPLLPADPYARAMARFWADYMQKGVEPFWLAHWTQGKVCMEEAKGILARLEELLAAGAGEGKRKTFFGGDRPGYVDLAACVLVTPWLGALEEVTGMAIVNDDDYPGVSRWAREYPAHEAVRPSVPTRDQMLAFYAPNMDAYRKGAQAILDKHQQQQQLK